MSRLSHYTATALLLGGCVYQAQATSASDLIAARDAYKSNNISKLSAIAQSMPSSYVLKDYPAYWLAWKALDKDDDTQVQQFLASVKEGLMPERIRNEWLKKLGKRGDWASFGREWQKLPIDARDDESSCYGQIYDLKQGRPVGSLDRFLDGRPTPPGCNQLVIEAAKQKLVSQDWLWRRTHLLLAGDLVSVAYQMADETGLPLDKTAIKTPASANLATPGGQEATLYSLILKGKSNIYTAASQLQQVEPSLGKDRAGFVWGQLARLAAIQLRSDQALEWYEKSDPAQLTPDQWDWWARSALRQKQWALLNKVIGRMPAASASKPAWMYWRGRALEQMNRQDEAMALFVQSSKGHHYYALLSQEELGNALTPATSSTGPSDDEISKVRNDPAIKRALELLTISQLYSRPDFRGDAQKEWRWAMRGRSDMSLLAAAEVARRENFYDMAIYSAERTKQEHDFSLRYLTPYRDVTQKYARQLSIDDAWVYGLIRQESRFVAIARSGPGAAGLMQIMPATANWIAKKIGLTRFAVNDIETNIQLGTWYLRYVLDRLSGNAVMATAAYNAGPGRAKAWQDSQPLDGTIYAETIPFSETRDYVQKVMANATFYSTAFGHTSISLKSRMGTIPAKQ